MYIWRSNPKRPLLICGIERCRRVHEFTINMGFRGQFLTEILLFKKWTPKTGPDVRAIAPVLLNKA